MPELYAESKGYDNVNPKIIIEMRERLKLKAEKMWADDDC